MVTSSNLACSSCNVNDWFILVCKIVSIDMFVSEICKEAKCFLIITCLINLYAASVKITCLDLRGRGTKLRRMVSTKLSS